MGYLDHIVSMEPILQAATDRGIPINNPARLALREALDGQMRQHFARMQELVPLELRNVEPKEGYVKGVKVQPGRIEEDGQGGYRWFDPGDEDSPAMWWPLMQRLFTPKPTEPVEIVEGINFIQPPESNGLKLPVHSFDPNGQVLRWCRVLPFRPSGGGKGQVLRYVRHRGHPVPKKSKEDKETSDKKGLETLAKKTKDPLYQTILGYRGVEKLKTTYVDGWEPGLDGRVHPQFTNKPATGQLSSVQPNAQNVPKHGKLASSFRRIIEARPGYRLIEGDFSSFHVLTTGFESRDADWMRMARLDMHSYVAGILLKHWTPEVKHESDDSLLERFKWLKSDPARKYVRDKQSKPSILGIGFGQGAKRLSDENPETIPNKKKAQELLDLLRALFPRVFKWQSEVRDLAHRQKYLRSRHGWMRWFWDVYRWSEGRGYMPGDDSEAAIAFLPANDAHCHLKDCLRRLNDRGLLDRYGFINTIHDSIVFECLAEMADECYHEVRQEMERPSTVLIDPLVAPGGLWVGAEFKWGQNWAEMVDLSPVVLSSPLAS